MRVTIPDQLARNCAKNAEREAWLAGLPALVAEMAQRWSLTIGDVFGGEEVSAAWVAQVVRADGSRAVLKVSMPHFEGEHEIDGLAFWNGDVTVRLIEADRENAAMLLERCEPGKHLRTLTEPLQDIILAGLLRRLWRKPQEPHSFRPLADLLSVWSAETEEDAASWPDAGLVRAGLALFRELPKPAPGDVLLATDLHAGNVLSAERKPWLAIDPKPFVGDPAYDATQHLLNCTDRLRQDADGTISRIADLLDVERERVRLWTFARLAAGPRSNWRDERVTIARRIAP